MSAQQQVPHEPIPTYREPSIAAAAKAVDHPLRQQILGALSKQEASPAQLAEAWGEPIGNVSYHTRELAKLGMIVMTRRRQVRGAIQHYYRSAFLPKFALSVVKPERVKAGVCQHDKSLDRVCEDCKREEALETIG